jgi:hypothetical protein
MPKRLYTRLVAGLLAFIAIVALVGVAFPGAQTLAGQILFSGPTTGRTFTLPDANGQVVMTATATAWKLAAGTVTLDGTNPSSATTGLAAIIACTVVDKRSVAPGDEVSTFTTITSAVAGRLDIYAWVGSATDPTLAASTDSDDVVDYVCIGS